MGCDFQNNFKKIWHYFRSEKNFSIYNKCQNIMYNFVTLKTNSLINLIKSNIEK